jgi:SOS response regulatory protein OraA/RecX
VVRAEDSSSASANFLLAIQETEWASVGVIRITPAEGPSFLVRVERIEDGEEFLKPGIVLDDVRTESVLAEAHVYLAEACAMGYLSRAEHCRSGLVIKLDRKGFGSAEINVALDWLEGQGYLDDARFASAWLRSRSGRLAEGRSRVIAELLKRGVPREKANTAADEYFEEHDEETVCKRAAEKLLRLGKTDRKLVDALIRKGFSHATIRKCAQNRVE